MVVGLNNYFWKVNIEKESKHDAEKYGDGNHCTRLFKVGVQIYIWRDMEAI